jgi:hypothetical protein
MHSALCHSGGLLKNIIEVLDGKNGEEWREILRRTMRRQNAFDLPQLTFEPTFRIYMEHRDDEDMFTYLGQHHSIFGYDHDYFRQRKSGEWFSYGAVPFMHNVVIVTPRQLWLQPTIGAATHLANLWVRAEEYGLKPCFDSIGPLALYFESGWFVGKRVYFAGAPYNGRMWSIDGTASKLRLTTCSASLDEEVFLDELWAFRLQ